MPHAKLIMEDGEPVLIELDRISEKEAISIPQIPFDEVMKLIKRTANDVHKGYVAIPKAIKPKNFEVSFGISISAEAGAIFSKVGVEGSFTVTMSWEEG